MKRMISLLILIAYSVPCLSYGFDAECLPVTAQNQDSFKRCDIEFQDNSLVVTYDFAKNKEFEATIPGDKISGLSGGEYSRRRVGESIAGAVLLGPLFLFTLFSKKKRDQFGVEYVTTDNKKSAILIQTKKKYGLGIKTGLESISGKEVDYGPEEKSAKK